MLEALFAAVAGLIIGSFLNVCIYRMPRDLSVVRPRSFCPACEHPVAWYDNIPVMSYLALRGHCRHCSKPIPLRYPVVEALTGALLFIFVLRLGLSVRAFKLSVFAALVVGLIFSDLEERILPDEFTIGGTVLGLLFVVLAPDSNGLMRLFLPSNWGVRWLSLTECVIGAAVPSLLLWGMGAAYEKIRHKEGLGFGDVLMVAMIGAFFGIEGAVAAVMYGSLLGSIIGIIYIYGTRKDPGSYPLPFGTFLGAGALAVAFMALR